MEITITPHILSGTAESIPSKSQAHRFLISAALSRTNTKIACPSASKDMDATASCLSALCASVRKEDGAYHVSPCALDTPARLFCGESGSTLRFILPLAGALGKEAHFLLEGRLPERPQEPLLSQLVAHGMEISRDENGNLHTKGQLQSGAFSLPGDVSSQFISGLLFALPLLSGDSTLTLWGTVESAPYIEMTEDALRRFGIRFTYKENTYYIPGGQVYTPPSALSVEGDWSSAAFFLSAGALGGGITLEGLSPRSLQGDREIADLLARFGAQVKTEDSRVTISPAPLSGISVSASQIPDLVPVLAVVAAAAKGETRIVDAARLRLKESDRLVAVSRMLKALGGTIEETRDGLFIEGGAPLRGGTVDSMGDHRIAMSAAIASIFCRGPVRILGAEAVEKSYPSFWDAFSLLGGQIERSQS